MRQRTCKLLVCDNIVYKIYVCGYEYACIYHSTIVTLLSLLFSAMWLSYVDYSIYLVLCDYEGPVFYCIDNTVGHRYISLIYNFIDRLYSVIMRSLQSMLL